MGRSKSVPSPWSSRSVRIGSIISVITASLLSLTPENSLTRRVNVRAVAGFSVSRQIRCRDTTEAPQSIPYNRDARQHFSLILVAQSSFLTSCEKDSYMAFDHLSPMNFLIISRCTDIAFRPPACKWEASASEMATERCLPPVHPIAIVSCVLPSSAYNGMR